MHRCVQPGKNLRQGMPEVIQNQRASGRIPCLGMVVNMVFLLRRLVGVVVEGFCTGVDMGVGMDVGMDMAGDPEEVAHFYMRMSGK